MVGEIGVDFNTEWKAEDYLVSMTPDAWISPLFSSFEIFTELMSLTLACVS